MTRKHIFPKGAIITFISNGEQQKFELTVSSSLDVIEEGILEVFEGYREESLCINGVNVLSPNIKSGYIIIEGRMADILHAEKKQTYFSLKNVADIMKLGVRKGDILHLKGISSFNVANVDYGDRVLCIELE